MPKQADSQIDTAVSQVIDLMKDRLGEPLTIDEMAVSARFSKFHFSRIFLTATGLSPARFLAAMRLGEAKRLLLCTHLTVTEIGVKVGYNSAGSFSSRFKFSVGMAPLAFRERRGVRPPSELPSPPPSSDCGTVHGRVTLPPEVCPGPVFLGLFPQPICEGTPVRCEVLSAPGEFLLDHVPSGRWHLLGYHNALTGRPRADHGGPTAPPLAAEDPPVPPARALTEPQWRGTV